IRQKLPPEWQKQADTVESEVIFELDGEQDRLLRADTEGRAKQLQQTTLQLESLRLSAAEVLAACDRCPQEARLRAEEVPTRRATGCPVASFTGACVAATTASRRRTRRWNWKRSTAARVKHRSTWRS